MENHVVVARGALKGEITIGGKQRFTSSPFHHLEKSTSFSTTVRIALFWTYGPPAINCLWCNARYNCILLCKSYQFDCFWLVWRVAWVKSSILKKDFLVLKSAFAAAAAVFLLSNPAGAQNCSIVGSSMYCDDGVSSQTIGNNTYYSNGVTDQHIGNFTYGSDGLNSQRIGNSTYYNDGTSSRTNGNTTYFSDGSSCRTIGTQVYCD